MLRSVWEAGTVDGEKVEWAGEMCNDMIMFRVVFWRLRAGQEGCGMWAMVAYVLCMVDESIWVRHIDGIRLYIQTFIQTIRFALLRGLLH